MSEHSAKRPKTTPMASAGVPVTDCLPPELLETILGFLDVRTLCTARLVCVHFRGAASRCIHSLEISAETLRSRPDATLNHFPNLSRVSVSGVKEEDFVMLARSPVAAAVTHLRLHAYCMQEEQREQIAAGFPLVPLPNLTSLTVGFGPYAASFFTQTLRELIMKVAVGPQTANLVVGLTSLTSLCIDVHSLREPFEAVTALTALQRLQICGTLSLIPFVAELTLLTHLRFVELRERRDELSDLAPMGSLARLRRLVHLGVRHHGRTGANMECQILASVATLTSLRSLDLKLCCWPYRSAFETVCMSPFSRLTALRLESGELDASFLPRLSLERLEDLSLSSGVKLDRDGVTALTRATGLTHLELWTLTVGAGEGLEELGRALTHMSRLRALTLGTRDENHAKVLGSLDAPHPTFSLKAIALLTELTSLELRERGVITSADLEVCLGLKKLRVLRMFVPCCRPAASGGITPETFFAIAKLPELCKFDLIGDVGISDRDLPDDVRARLNAERHAKGWPPLHLNVYADFGSYHHPLV